MKTTKLALSLLVGIGTGCTTVPPAPLVSMSGLPNCFDANYDQNRDLFTIRNDVGNPVNQQCLLRVEPRGDVVSEFLGGIWDAVTGSAPRLTAGSYRIYLSNGGGGGAGGTLQGFTGGGGGGGGAGAMETQATVTLTEGVYKLTMGAGGAGGTAGELRRGGFGGGVGWAGSPSNMVRVATGEVVIGTPGADTHARLTRAQSERTAGKRDGHGGSGPGQASGGHGGVPEIKDSAQTKGSGEVQGEPGASVLASGLSGMMGAPDHKRPGGGDGGATSMGAEMQARPGASKLASGLSVVGGAPGEDDKHLGSGGGGGGATSMGHGGGGGGESPGRMNIAPERGSLGSGGGGGEGSSSEADPGARGGHGYIALRPI